MLIKSKRRAVMQNRSGLYHYETFTITGCATKDRHHDASVCDSPTLATRSVNRVFVSCKDSKNSWPFGAQCLRRITTMVLCMLHHVESKISNTGPLAVSKPGCILALASMDSC